MLGFIARRIVSLFFVLLFAVTLTFCLLRAAPGNPFKLSDKLNTEENVRKQERLHNLDGPIWWQCARYLGLAKKHPVQNADGTERTPSQFHGVLQGKFGDSLKLKERGVGELISDALPTSATIGLMALIISTTLGVWFGAMAAVKKHTWVDAGMMFTAMLAVSIPTFVVGPALVLIFGFWLKWLPVGGLGGFANLILPSLTLAGPFVAYIARLTRTSMLEVLAQDFVRTAKAKGLSDQRVIFKHAMKVAILPVVSFLGPLSAGVLTGSLVVEKVFSLPGMGEFFVNSVLARDMFVCCGAVTVYCSLLVFMNLIVDIAYQWLDPRIRTV